MFNSLYINWSVGVRSQDFGRRWTGWAHQIHSLQNWCSNNWRAETAWCVRAASLIVPGLKDKLTNCTTSSCIYCFAQSYVATYIGRRTKCLSDWINRNHPATLSKGTGHSNISAIAKHLAELRTQCTTIRLSESSTGHQQNEQDRFQLACWSQLNQSASYYVIHTEITCEDSQTVMAVN